MIGDRSEASVIRMEMASGVFDARHADNTEVLLALLTQNKELEGESKPVVLLILESPTTAKRVTKPYIHIL